VEKVFSERERRPGKGVDEMTHLAFHTRPTTAQ